MTAFPLPLPPLPQEKKSVFHFNDSTQNNSISHVHNSASYGSDFEFDPRLSDVQDPPLSPKLIFSPFHPSVAQASFPHVQQHLDSWPSPTPSRPPLLSVRQLVATELRDEAPSSVASSPRSPQFRKVQGQQQSVDLKKEQKGHSISDRRVLHLSPLTMRIHHSDEDPTEEISRDPWSVDEDTPIIKAGRADQSTKNRKKWNLKDFLRRSKGDGDHRSCTITQQTKATMTPRQRSPQSSPPQRLPSPISSTHSSPQRSPARLMTPHEAHYKLQKAHAEEMRKKTFLPYKQGLLGCLGGPTMANTSDLRAIQQQVW